MTIILSFVAGFIAGLYRAPLTQALTIARQHLALWWALRKK